MPARSRPAALADSQPDTDPHARADTEGSPRRMTYWQLAMILTFPLCLHPSRLRTWGAMLASGMLGHLASSFYAAPVVLFVAIDTLAALVILARPKGTAQQYIGLVYVGMICSHIGYVFASNPLAITVYYQLLTAAGWLAWGILLAWGAGDVGKRVSARFGFSWTSFHRAPIGEPRR